MVKYISGKIWKEALFVEIQNFETKICIKSKKDKSKGEKMKKLLKKRIMIMVVAVFSMFAFTMPEITTFAAVPEPATTEVVITKLQSATGYPNGAINNVNGSQKTMEELSTALGTTVTALPGVTFTVYTLPAGTTKEQAAVLTQTELDAMPSQTLTATDVNGQASVSLPTGKYWIVETGKPNTVSSSLAVPFFLELPVMNSTNNGYLTSLYVYPKNVVAELPIPTKTVDTLENLKSTKDIGELETWYLQATVPTNIADYSKYQFDDAISTQLDYAGNVVLTYGTKSSIAAGTGLTLVKDTDYTITTQPNIGQPGGNLSVRLTSAGLQNVVSHYSENTILVLAFQTKINATAVMGTDIPNTYTLIYNNTGGATGTPTSPDTPVPSNEVNVCTGGRQFVKTAGATTTPLTGAEFVVYDKTTGMYMIQNSTTLAVSWTLDKNNATKFISNELGNIAIKGLDYSTYTRTENNGVVTTLTHDYYLEETKAPATYNLLKTDIPFTIAADSYNSTSGTVDLNTDGVSETQIVNNKGPQIPQTGGIGTAIFTVAGLALMGVSFKFAKKNSKRK